jgi:hypothetical protein
VTCMRMLLVLSLTSLVALVVAEEPPRRFAALEERLMERAAKIPIPRVDFKDITFADALDLLRTEGRKHDPQRQGILIEVHVEPWPMVEFLPGSKTSKPAPPGGWPLYEPLKQRITVSLHDTSLADALVHVSALVNCRVVANRIALMVTDGNVAVDPLITHTIPLAAAPKAEVHKILANPKQYFTDAGATFSGNASCVVEDRGSALVVTNTQEQLDLVHAILESLVPHKPTKKRR